MAFIGLPCPRKRTGIFSVEEKVSAKDFRLFSGFMVSAIGVALMAFMKVLRFIRCLNIEINELFLRYKF